MNRMIIKSFHLNRQIIRQITILNHHSTMLPLIFEFPSIINRKHPLQMNDSLNQLSQKRGMKLWNEKLLRKMYLRKRSFDAEPERLRARSEWQDWDYASEIYAFAQRLHESQLNDQILIRAFTHRSYVNEQHNKQKNLGVQDVHEQLEDNAELIDSGCLFMKKFLSQYLRYHLQQAPEECIQSLVQYLMSTSVMSDISKWIGCVGKINYLI